MDINMLLKGVNCSCGRFHSCDIKYVYIENGAISKLSEICEEYGNILLVADENTRRACGDKVETALRGKNVSKVVFDGDKILIPNENAVEKVEQSLKNSDLIIGIGSGVIQDLCKYVSFMNKIPYMVVATAPSMDGYASNGAAMILKGMKETVAATLPRAIIADTAILKDAPIEMIKAGYGDIIGKFSALNDWKLSHAVNDEYFCNYIYDMTYDMVEKTLKLANGLLKRDEKSVKVLMEALVTVGVLMSFAGSSRPASGSEHHLSHFFEIMGIINGEEYLPHGIDVAYSTVVTAWIREYILSHELPVVQYKVSKAHYEEKMQEIYKEVAQGCIKLQDKAGNYKKDRLSIYRVKEKEIREILSKMPKHGKIKEMLELCEIDMSGFYKAYSKEKIHNAIRYSKDLKDRYTVIWMNYDLFGEK